MEFDVTDVCREKWFEAVFSTYQREGSLDLALSEGRRSCEDFLTLSREGMSGRGKKRPLTKADLPVVIPVVSTDQPGPSQSRRRNRGTFNNQIFAHASVCLPCNNTHIILVVQRTNKRPWTSSRHSLHSQRPTSPPASSNCAFHTRLCSPW